MKVLKERNLRGATDVWSFLFADEKTCNWLFHTYMTLVDDYFHIFSQSVTHIIRKRFVIPLTCFGLGQAVMLYISIDDF